MAGHSKWANTKHRKAAQDARRGKIFTKLIREIGAAVRLYGADISTNPRLRAVVDKALISNMTRDTVNRAIARAAGEQDGANMEELTYEGYGPGGVAVMVTALSDNRNRTAADVRHAFGKFGGNLGSEGSVGYLFRKLGVISFSGAVDEERLLELALEAGAEDLVSHDDGQLEVLTAPEALWPVVDALAAAGFVASKSEVALLPSTKAELTEVEVATAFLKTIDLLEDLDDVQEVYTNAELSDAVLAQLDH